MGKKQSSGRAKTILLYVFVRILFFAVPLAIMLWMDFLPIYAAITAALIGLALSLIFLQSQRDPLVELLDRKNSFEDHRERTEDELIEDQLADEFRRQQAASLRQESQADSSTDSVETDAATPDEKPDSAA